MSLTGDFVGAPSKLLLRQEWDRPIIEAMQASKGRPLRYFGLPGPGTEDVADWRSALDHVTAVELLRTGAKRTEDLDRHRRLNVSLCRHDIDYQLLRGLVEDVIWTGHDLEQAQPRCCDSSDPAFLKFTYDLVNLDFFGGAGYELSGQSKRMRALKKLIERQHGTEFLLLLTLNVRDKIGDAIKDYLEQMKQRVKDHAAAKQAVEWYAACGDGLKKHRVKAAIPAFVQQIAEAERFRVHCFPPVAYVGGANATMVHFVFRLVPTDDVLTAFSEQQLSDLIRRPLLVATDTAIHLPAEQHNGFDWQHCHDTFDDVPGSLRDRLKAQALAHKA